MGKARIESPCQSQPFCVSNSRTIKGEPSSSDMDGHVILVFILTAIGLAILVAELFIPTAGMLAILATTCFVGAFYFAYRGWYVTDQMGWWWGYVSGVVIAIPSVIVGGLYWVPRTTFGKELFVHPQSLKELEPFQEEEAQLRRLIHHRGKAKTLFSPGGMVQIGKERFHAESEGVVIDPDADVEVIGVNGNRLVVRPIDLTLERAAAAAVSSDPIPTAQPAVSSPPPTLGASNSQSVEKTSAPVEGTPESASIEVKPIAAVKPPDPQGSTSKSTSIDFEFEDFS